VARVLSTALVLALLAATALAFVLTERAKLERSPIYATHAPDPVFSPDGTLHPEANLDFRLRRPERIEVWIESEDGERQRTLLTPRDVRRGATVRVAWNGIRDDATASPDGVYLPVVKLFRSHRTIVLPNPIRLDTKPPVVTVKRPQHPILSPDGDGHRDRFTTRYRISERGNAILNVGGHQVAFTRCCKQIGELHWNGKFGDAQIPAKPGQYLMTAQAQDEAGNKSKPFPFAIALVRYIVLGRERVVVRAGGKFALRVSTDAPFVHWTLHGRSGTARRGTLKLRAPKSPGVYKLYVSISSGHAASATVVTT
jgi:hypothetical protein